MKKTSFVLTRNDGVVYEEGGEERSTVRNPPNNRFEQRNEGRGKGPGLLLIKSDNAGRRFFFHAVFNMLATRQKTENII